MLWIFSIFRSLMLALQHKTLHYILLLLSVSSTERAPRSWRTSQQGRSFCRSMLWMLTRAPMAGSHTASCTKTPRCPHSVYTQTQVLKHTHHRHLHLYKHTRTEHTLLFQMGFEYISYLIQCYKTCIVLASL